MRLLDTVENPDFRNRKGLPDIMTDTSVGGIYFDHTLHIEEFDQTCRDCHFGVVHQPQVKTYRMFYCLECHEGEEAAPQTADCTVCHESQLAMNEGSGAEGVDGSLSMMYEAKVNCTDCHSEVADGVFRPGASTCIDCHDQDYAEVFSEWRLDTKKAISRASVLRADVEKALTDADKRGRDTTKEWDTYKKALRNLNFVRDDGTNGVHNIDYASDILANVTSDLNQIKKRLQTSW
jgi:nitrate/TMAO reductase-like tetraheme cytochrome c subunit